VADTLHVYGWKDQPTPQSMSIDAAIKTCCYPLYSYLQNKKLRYKGWCAII